MLALVLVVSTMIAVSCLKRETKKFHKKQGKRREDVVMDIHGLEKIMIKYVSRQLTQGMLKKMANSLSPHNETDEEDSTR